MPNTPYFFQSGGSSSAGGGGGSLQWIEDANAPIPSTENNNRVYLYPSGDSQELWTILKVPASYLTGSPIALKISLYSPSTSNTILLLSQSTLIRSEVDAISSTTNQRTSTNSAITNVSPANCVRVASLDISSTTGQINSVNISAGDTIKVRIYRSTDSDTADVRFLPYASEVTFS